MVRSQASYITSCAFAVASSPRRPAIAARKLSIARLSGNAAGALVFVEVFGAVFARGFFEIGIPCVLWAFSRYQRRFGVDLRMAATIAGSALIAAYPTARLATGLDPHVLRLSFAVFLATTAGTVAYGTWRGSVRGERGPRRAWGWVTIVGVIGGVVSGFFGVGGAFIAPPLLTTFFGLRQLEAQGLALALVSPSAFIALLAYAGAGQVDWVVGLPLALGGMAAISAGVAFASHLPERRMRLVFCALLLLTAVLLALRG